MLRSGKSPRERHLSSSGGPSNRGRRGPVTHTVARLVAGMGRTPAERLWTLCLCAALALWLTVAFVFLSLPTDEVESEAGFHSSHSGSHVRLSHARDNLRAYFAQSQWLQSGRGQLPLQKQHVDAAILEQIKRDTIANGWPPVALYHTSARMPAEEIEAYLDRFWRKPGKQAFAKSYDAISGVVSHKPVPFGAHLDETKETSSAGLSQRQMPKLQNVVKPKRKTTQSRQKPKRKVTVAGKRKQQPSNGEWTHPCPGDEALTEACVLPQIKYWSRGVESAKAKPRKYFRGAANGGHNEEKFVTFTRDCGGFNNIRQGFEFHAMVAWLTNRTLVIPPSVPWYLIDFGMMSRGKEQADDRHAAAGQWQVAAVSTALTQRLQQAYATLALSNAHSGVSSFRDFFNIADMRLALSVVSTDEFVNKGIDKFNIPMQYCCGAFKTETLALNQLGSDESKLPKQSRKKQGKDFEKWLNELGEKSNCQLDWGQLANALVWDSQLVTGAVGDLRIDESRVNAITNGHFDSAQKREAFVDNRKLKTYDARLEKECAVVHFPSCRGGSQANDFRYLGQIARSVIFETAAADRSFKRTLRDFVHLRDEIFDYAFLVVRALGGLFNFHSLHIRRNELQYKYVFCNASMTYRNVKPLVEDSGFDTKSMDGRPVVYVATDETNEEFFDAFANWRVFRWKHFFGEGGLYAHVKVPPKWEGQIEMVICAAAHLFFGTKESTFSSYISRLRGYFGAPFADYTLFHHVPMRANRVPQSGEDSLQWRYPKPYRGQIYKIEFPELWRDVANIY